MDAALFGGGILTDAAGEREQSAVGNRNDHCKLIKQQPCGAASLAYSPSIARFKAGPLVSFEPVCKDQIRHIDRAAHAVPGFADARTGVDDLEMADQHRC